MCCCLVTKSCPTLCDPTDCNLPGSSVHGDSPGKNTEVGCHDLLQGIFPTQGSNPGLPHCRWILYHLSHQGNPFSNIMDAINCQGWDFPGIVVAKNCLAVGTNSPGASEQPRPHVTTREPSQWNKRPFVTQQRLHAPQLRHDAARYTHKIKIHQWCMLSSLEQHENNTWLTS